MFNHVYSFYTYSSIMVFCTQMWFASWQQISMFNRTDSVNTHTHTQAYTLTRYSITVQFRDPRVEYRPTTYMTTSLRCLLRRANSELTKSLWLTEDPFPSYFWNLVSHFNKGSKLYLCSNKIQLNHASLTTVVAKLT